MTKRTSKKFWGILYLCCLCIPATNAEIYKYRDEQGNLHFTDRPPTEKRSEKNIVNPSVKNRSTTESVKDKINKREQDAQKARFNTVKKVTTRSPIKNPVKDQSRTIELAKIFLDLEPKTEGRIIVGREYSGTNCSRITKYMYTTTSQRQIEPEASQAIFKEIMTENGYKLFKKSDSVFNVQKQDAAELILAALIRDITFNVCRTDRYGSKKAHTLVHLKIEWQLFDPLEREVVYKSTTEGFDDDYYVLAGEYTDFAARQAAFRNALKNLLADKKFVSLLQKKNNESISENNDKPIQIKYVRGDGAGLFIKDSAKLQQGVVTIRSLVGHGTGFVISKDGYILTNAHVIQSAKKVAVLIGKQNVKADVIRIDFTRDVALLRLVNSLEVQPVPLSQNKINTGESIFIIGTPLDESLSHTVTKGILSATRVVKDGRAFYQTDASINPGNSGGPAFDPKGEVIGIAVSGLVDAKGSALNINFLIPIDDALEKLAIQYGG